ncbi:hypothetical protein BV394_07440 [Brevirhabdus pacifica]|uniref:Uncharacterized protein n=1 Tax=Brevirhabdus pacifica TaxID=1267768 RepID=A0A1U7DHT3_9RHOB|nr:hypothetical protein [Brevirhabdus pacifica]APX89567.1 hypothetical protein BV394_07440 [Brevirhabdus pacifica]OWU76428.1 hypothetical protein ATO5_08855 [Loktanella sp. 22II-4b]PJJ85768.1 hypothetical protein CLV77_0297 [Brevirhabdus pacifica]
MLRTILPLVTILFLAACGADNIYASDEAVARAAFVNPEPASITLVTAINNRSGEGGHTAVIVNGSQQVLWDPAGTWYHRSAPERHDLHYGFTNTLREFFYDYHARETFHLVVQEVPVTRAVADQAIRAFAAQGAAPKSFCSNYTSKALRTVPGFENMPVSFFPKTTMNAFAQLPGVKTRKIYDDDSDNNKSKLAAGN